MKVWILNRQFPEPYYTASVYKVRECMAVMGPLAPHVLQSKYLALIDTNYKMCIKIILPPVVWLQFVLCPPVYFGTSKSQPKLYQGYILS